MTITISPENFMFLSSKNINVSNYIDNLLSYARQTEISKLNYATEIKTLREKIQALELLELKEQEKLKLEKEKQEKLELEKEKEEREYTEILTDIIKQLKPHRDISFDEFRTMIYVKLKEKYPKWSFDKRHKIMDDEKIKMILDESRRVV